MTDVLDPLRGQLLAAERAFIQAAASAPVRSRALRRCSSRSVLAASVALLLGGSALALATQPWNALGAHHSRGAPASTTSLTAPPRAQLAMLSVLRRPQAAKDQSPAAIHLLGLIGDRQIGVRLSYVRLLTPASGQVALLVSLEHVHGPQAANLCLFFGDQDPLHANSSSGVCGNTQTLRSNGLIANVGSAIFGIVPDGVARVVAQYADGHAASSPVRDNYFAIAAAPTSTSPIGHITSPHALRWLDNAGRTIGPPSMR
jgi:hypothetical protein